MKPKNHDTAAAANARDAAGPPGGSGAYWERRYRKGRNSGPGSYRRLAQFKAETMNRLVADERIASVIEFGCGDGNQLALMAYPNYCGVDVSATAIETCRRRFAGDPRKRFTLRDDLDESLRFDCAVSLDVIFHLVEDAVFDAYMRDLFRFATRCVVIYASDMTDAAFQSRHGETPAPHVRHRRFTDWIAMHAPRWRPLRFVANAYPYSPADPENTSFADFHVFAP